MRVKNINKKECICNDDRAKGIFKNGHFGNCPLHSPAELNLASQDWEERFLMATIYQEDSGFQKFGEGEPTKWKTDWDKVKQFIEKEISLARTEEAIKCKKQFIEKEISLARTEVLAEYKAEIVKTIKNFRFSIPVGEGKFTTLICPDCKEQSFICKKCIINLISPNKE